MDRSRTWQLSANEARVANSTAFALSTGRAPGRPRQTGQIFVFGSAPNLLAQPQNALEAVSNCTCTSSPITGSYFAKTSGERAAAGIGEFYRAARGFWRKGGVIDCKWRARGAIAYNRERMRERPLFELEGSGSRDGENWLPKKSPKRRKTSLSG